MVGFFAKVCHDTTGVSSSILCSSGEEEILEGGSFSCD